MSLDTVAPLAAEIEESISAGMRLSMQLEDEGRPSWMVEEAISSLEVTLGQLEQA